MIMEKVKYSFWATILFIGVLTTLHVIKPEVSPVSQFISEYAIGRFGWLMSLAFILWSAAFFFLFLGLKNKLTGISGKTGLACLVISSLGCLLAGIFTTDPVSTAQTSISGTLHNLGGSLAMAIPLGSVFIAISMFRDPYFFHVRKRILASSILSTAGFLISAGSLGYMFGQPDAQPGSDMPVGIPTRFEVVTYCIWLVVLTYSISKTIKTKAALA